MNKCYGLRMLKDGDSIWSDIIAVSNSPEKLKKIVTTHNSFTTMTKTCPERIKSGVIWDTTERNGYPRYSCVELAYVC